MNLWDERILEYLEAEDLCSSDLIASEAFESMPSDVVEERLRLLQYAGLVHSFSDSLWELTDEGQRYIKGDLDARHQPTPTPDRALRG